MGKRTTYRPDHHCKLARELGKKGYAITDAAERMGVPYPTLLGWEKQKPEFREAFKAIRRNSERWRAQRFERLLQKSEAELEAALIRIRAKRRAEREKFNAKFENITVKCSSY